MRKGCRNTHARSAMTSNSFRARFSGIRKGSRAGRETRKLDRHRRAKGPIKKRASGESNFGYGHFADAFFLAQKILPKRLKGLSEFFCL